MKHKLIMILAFALVLLAFQATAREAPTITQIDPAEIPVPTLEGANTGLVGNLNPGYWRLTGWFTGQEEYKYLFNPVEQLTCNTGFQLLQVHMILDFDVTMTYPITFQAWADLEDALWDDGRQCWVPGIEDCRSSTYTITIDAPGTYDIALPIDCACANLFDPTGAPYWYMLSMHFLNSFPANLISDDFPTACTSWNNWGEGWYDLVWDAGFPGNILMWGDVVCCEEPVPTESRTWGDIKSLFR